MQLVVVTMGSSAQAQSVVLSSGGVQVVIVVSGWQPWWRIWPLPPGLCGLEHRERRRRALARRTDSACPCV